MIEIKSCPKAYSKEQDKACSPTETVARVRERLTSFGSDILAEARRIDTGRLGIPVYMSICGDAARRVMPTRKQMGKGASPIQAEASALMELTERYSFFTFWDDETNFETLTWSEAEAKWPGRLIPVSEIIKSAGDTITEEDAVRVLDLVRWRFYPATNVTLGREEYVPLDWFKKLNEFNGSSAGNTFEESILQGASELVERHVSAVTDRTTPTMPTLDPDSSDDPVLAELVRAFRDNGIRFWLKDMTLGMPAPTVAALAYDPATFPDTSEIVYTAGTAASPAKAAIRALTEVAQLAGDFETEANYEASGLPKYTSLDAISHITDGSVAPLSSLPSITAGDIGRELHNLTEGLSAQGYTLYSVSTMHPTLGIPANYSFVPGFLFRERTEHASLGLFVGRILAEESPLDETAQGLEVLEAVYPGAHFLPFFRALASLRMGDTDGAARLFAAAEPLQPCEDDKGLAAFYQAYALTQSGDFAAAEPHLDRAITHCPEVKEYFNLRGVSRFKRKDFEHAIEDFRAALDLDSGSAMDLANMGMCYKNLGRRDEAIHCLANALKLDQSLDFARVHLDEILGDR
ncbi:ribosomal protein S12 methylthiotransferase accessory factor [Desulfobaculum xiamenense]|uniref:Ribosomal protein S12 methylthiotransferase accessory factor n=1 Tax=Desulfobaculum xiamenense TaxID=995050 RepID=A0A846QK18_9BACT|nr:YcaO-like family protein [Desulfobaculum xiamenense]NJB67467.1 ribosomal protein S12 methylthiotransferase accessory factor [Desulfobaculum xiamenense]